MTGNAKGMIRLTWTSLDGASEASWKFGPEDSEDKVLDLLERAVTYVRTQRGEHATAVQELESEIYPERRPERTPEELKGQRIAMTPPAALSDRPSDGGPPQDGFGWASMPTTSIPEHLGSQWEMVPEDER